MKKLAISLAVLMLALAVGNVAHSAQPMNPGKFCKDGGAEAVADALEAALLAAHGITVDLEVTQGACASTVATHASAYNVNTTALATNFCIQVVGPSSDVLSCVEHVEPALLDIFHGD